MCQKAFGGFFGPLVTAFGLEWTRGNPALYASSNKVSRGFCAECGTPLSYDYGGDVEIAIGSLDDPEQAAPVVQVNLTDKLSFIDNLHALPVRDFEAGSAEVKFMAGISDHQHPDHDTEIWPLKDKP